jgi:hypothetical protein
MENHSFAATDGDPQRYIVGNPNAPYINDTLIPQGTLFTNYFANEHPSLPNYLDMAAGTTGGCSDDRCPPDSIQADNLFHQLGDAGIPFATFAQSMPAPCSLTDHSPFVVHHVPEAYFTNVDAASGLAYACPSTDLPLPDTLPDTLPSFSFVVPDQCHNMHGTSSTLCPGHTDQIIRDGDTWLSQAIPGFLSRGALVILTWDEASKDSTGGGGHIVTAMVGPNVVAGGTDAAPYSHFGLLAGLEDHFGLPRLAEATTATALPIPSPPTTPPPTIIGFDPPSGVAGDAVTITGTGFTGATAVEFGGVPAIFSVTDDASIGSTVPEGAVSGPISVTTPGGTGLSSISFVVTGSGLQGMSIASGPGGSDSSFTTPTVTPATSVAFLWVFDSLSTGTPATVTGVTGLSGAWAKIDEVVSTNGHRRLSLWYATGLIGTGGVSVTLSEGSQSTIQYVMEGFIGIDPISPYVATNVRTAATDWPSTTVGVTPDALGSPGDAYYVGLNQSSAEDVTPLNGASEITDTNASLSTGIETNQLAGWTTGDMGGSWTSEGRSVLIGIELNAFSGV